MHIKDTAVLAGHGGPGLRRLGLKVCEFKVNLDWVT